MPRHPHQTSALVLVLTLVLVLAGCLEPGRVVCAGAGGAASFVCPAGYVCGERTCIPAGALDGCVGSPDDTACTIGGAPGRCIMGVCTYQRCGDGEVTGTEQCDQVAGRTCESLGHHGGTLACGPTCQFDVSACRRCGDGVVEPGIETCDGAPATDCVERGFDLGPTRCTSLCNADLRACEFTSWQRVFTSSRVLVAAASAGPADVLVAGANGYSARFDGVGWTDGAVVTNERLAEVEASATSYWLAAQTALFRLARSASLSDASTWQAIAPPATPVRALDVVADDDVWVGGPARTLHAYDGVGWTPVPLPVGTSGGVEAIWRQPGLAVVGLGDGTVLAGVDAAALATVASCAPVGVAEVWADADGSIGVACADARLVRVPVGGPAVTTTFPGATWIGADAHAGAVLVVGADGRPLWRDGAYWSWIDQPMADARAAVITDQDAFIVGGTSVYQRPRRWWTSTTTIDPTAPINAAWSRSEVGGEVVWVASGASLARGGRLVPTTLADCSAAPTRISGLAGDAPGPMFAIGSIGANGVLLRIDDPTAAVVTLRCLAEVPQDLSSVASSPDGAALAVGNGGRVILAPTAGPVRPFLGAASGLPGNVLTGAWIGGNADAWVVGAAGAVAHWDGASWAITPPFVTSTLQAVRAWPGGEVLAVGSAGEVWAGSGGTWTELAGPPGARTLRAIAGARRDDVWIAGLDGVLSHFDGTSWSRVVVPPSGGLDIDTVQVVPGRLLLRVGNASGSVRQLRGL